VQLLEVSQTIPNALRRPSMAMHRVLIIFGLVFGVPFVAIAAATATNYVYQNGSGVQSNSRSHLAQWWSGGAGTMHKYCYYRS
jgi:hypothetical protein